MNKFNSILDILLLPGFQVCLCPRCDASLLPAAMLPMAQFQASLLSLTQLDEEDGCESRCKIQVQASVLLHVHVTPISAGAQACKDICTPTLCLTSINVHTLIVCHT